MAINKVILLGNVGRDPEVRYVANNVPVARFSLATSKRGYKTADGKITPERTEWHNLVLWRGLAEIAQKYVKKGTQIYIEGEIQYNSYEKDGITRYSTEIVVSEMQMLGRRDDNTNSGFAPQAQAAPQPQTAPQSQTIIQPVETAQNTEPFGANDQSEDNLPF